jgi:hypothetical protein
VETPQARWLPKMFEQFTINEVRSTQAWLSRAFASRSRKRSAHMQMEAPRRSRHAHNESWASHEHTPAPSLSLPVIYRQVDRAMVEAASIGSSMKQPEHLRTEIHTVRVPYCSYTKTNDVRQYMVLACEQHCEPNA